MAIETIWRPKRSSLLTDAQKQEKLKKDSEYEIAHLNLSADLKAAPPSAPKGGSKLYFGVKDGDFI